MMTTNRIALAVALALAVASPAAAAPSSSGLTTGGFTVAGPGTTSLAANVSGTVYTDASGNLDACTTVANSGRAAVRLTVTGNGGSSSIDVAVGGTGTLCRDQVTQVGLLCLGVGTTSCTAQWRVDRD